MSDQPPKILAVDDDDGIRTQYRWALSNYKVLPAADRSEALSIFERETPSVAIVDLGLPPDPDGASEGLAIVAQILKLKPWTKIIVVTGNEEREHAIKAVASGAYDFLRKPIDTDVLNIIVERAFGLYALEEENRKLIAAMPQSPVAGIVGGSPQLGKVLRDAEKVARTDISVLILGESGTGKEMFSHAIHRMGSRASKPFVAMNCAAIPENLLEAELFGHEKGAFTGAIKRTIGKIEHANGGTLFLDEVGDIPLAMQVKLLRFLEDQVIERVGGREKIQIDVRILCATNQDLQNLIKEGRFREDLYFRINETSLILPPLREREGDAVLLARYFLKKYSSQYDRAFLGFSGDAISALGDYSWPGNVRELENRIKRAATMSDGPRVIASDLEIALAEDAPNLDLRAVRQEAERKVIQSALGLSKGNMSRAATLLGVSRPTLYNLISDLGIEIQPPEVSIDEGEKVSV